jgi:hypothetical protein
MNMNKTEEQAMTHTHVVMLGDSVFDNNRYVAGGPDVLAHMSALAPDGWRATLCAVDGATTSTFQRQLDNVPDDATHLAISLGGNDALQTMPLMTLPTRSVGMGLQELGERLVSFETAYRRCVSSALNLGRPVLLLTIYDGDFEPNLRVMTRVGVALFNDVIIRVGRERELPTVEMRHVCNEPGDFKRGVEPSVRGGEKVATAVLDALAQLGHQPDPLPARELPLRSR